MKATNKLEEYHDCPICGDPDTRCVHTLKPTLLKVGVCYQFEGFTAILTDVYDGSFFFWAAVPIERQVNGVSIGLGNGFHVRNDGQIIKDRDGVKLGKEWS